MKRLFLMVGLLTFTACGRESFHSPEVTAPSMGHAAVEVALTGTWIEDACKEGYVGPDAPPPEYSKGILRFTPDKVMRMSSQLYDDSKCSVARPRSDEELAVPYVLTPSFETSDGSVAIDLQWPNEGAAPTPYYALVRIKDGKLYLAMYNRADRRPKSMDEAVASVFVPR